jgi:hypothetical protein
VKKRPIYAVSIIFDGTSRVGEALAILLQFVDAEWCVQQRLVRVQMLAKSLSGEELARELISVLSVTYSIRCPCCHERWNVGE